VGFQLKFPLNPIGPEGLWGFFLLELYESDEGLRFPRPAMEEADMAIMATCHCGKSQIELPHVPATATECNCTFCARTGALWAYFPEGDLRFLSTDGQSVYSASDGINLHYFCSVCGIQTWGDSPDYGLMYETADKVGSTESDVAGVPRRHAVNLRTVDGLDWSSIIVEKIDGRNAW
jgi:hypothetical protein